MRNQIYLPNMSNINLSKKPKTSGHTMQGAGGSVLLCKGGVGSASSYDSPEDYAKTTGRRGGIKQTTSGNGFGCGLGLGINKNALHKKLESLSISQKPKLKNISFNL